MAAFLLAPAAAGYIRLQRDRLARDAIRLGPQYVEEFEPYFQRELLDSARLVVSSDLGLPRFPYARALRRTGFSLPDPQLIAAITFDHLIAVREGESSSRLLFHELVHVVQYRLLGVSAFARLYVEGFLAGGAYERIPLERCASALEKRFARGGAAFSVETAVRRSAPGRTVPIRAAPDPPRAFHR